MVTGAKSAQEMMRDIDPTINAINETTKGMADALAPAVKKRRGRPVKITGPGGTQPTAALAKYNENLERLKVLKAHFDSSYDPLVALLTSMTASNTAAGVAPPTVAAPSPAAAPALVAPGTATPQTVPGTPPIDDEFPPPPPQEAAPKKATATASTMTEVKPEEIIQAMKENLAEAKQKKYAKLLKFVQDNPDVLGVDVKGRAVVRGQVMHGTDFRTIAKSMFTLKSKDAAPAGLRIVLGELKAAGLPKDAIVSNAARGIFQQSPDPEMVKPVSDTSVTALETPKGSAAATQAARPKSAHVRRIIERMNESQRGTPQSGKGDLMKMLPGCPIKMLRLYE